MKVNERSGVNGISDNLRNAGHILVVDDDPEIRQIVIAYLQDRNVPARSASNRSELNEHLIATRPALIILDLQLGREDGFDILRAIRSRSDIPVIIISGHRHDDADCIAGLELGADDYIVKPFNLTELFARICATLRRHEMGRNARDRERGSYSFGGWRLECRERRLVNPEGILVTLNNSLYALLLAFLNAPLRPLAREHLLLATRVYEDINDRSIDVQILRLRRKLEPVSNRWRIIRTARGKGYIFTLPVERF